MHEGKCVSQAEEIKHGAHCRRGSSYRECRVVASRYDTEAEEEIEVDRPRACAPGVGHHVAGSLLGQQGLDRVNGA